MFDISLNLTKYLVFWGLFFLIGFFGTFSIAILLHEKNKAVYVKRGNYNKKRHAGYPIKSFSYFLVSLIVSLCVGTALLLMAMYGVFDVFLNYFLR